MKGPVSAALHIAPVRGVGFICFTGHFVVCRGFLVCCLFVCLFLHSEILGWLRGFSRLKSFPLSFLISRDTLEALEGLGVT